MMSLNQGAISVTKLQYFFSTVITRLVAKSIDNIIINTYGSVSSFLSKDFKLNTRHLVHVHSLIEGFYDKNNRTYPDSLIKTQLDIINLLAIRNSLNNSNDDPNDFFRNTRDLRNICFHSIKLSEEIYKEYCIDLRDIIESCPHVNDDEKETCVKDLDYMLENLMICDRQSLAKNVEMKTKIEPQTMKKLNLLTKTYENGLEKKRQLEQRLNVAEQQLNLVSVKLAEAESRKNSIAHGHGVTKRAIPIKMYDFTTGRLIDVNAYKQSKSS